MSRYYAGIGSRQTPQPVLDEMRHLAECLALYADYVLRSGGADGADSAFEQGCDYVGGRKQIFLPWSGFNGKETTACSGSEMFGVFDVVGAKALVLAAQFHPAWHACKHGARKLHARNGYQVLGPDLCTPIEFVVCWTPGGFGGGGTGQALRIAQHHNIPVYDFGDRACPLPIDILEKHA